MDKTKSSLKTKLFWVIVRGNPEAKTDGTSDIQAWKLVVIVHLSFGNAHV